MARACEYLHRGIERNFTGKVIDISPEQIRWARHRFQKSRLRLTEQPENLLWGMTAEVTIEE